jgi:hypothetical protein
LSYPNKTALFTRALLNLLDPDEAPQRSVICLPSRHSGSKIPFKSEVYVRPHLLIHFVAKTPSAKKSAPTISDLAK